MAGSDTYLPWRIILFVDDKLRAQKILDTLSEALDPRFKGKFYLHTAVDYIKIR